MRACVWGQHFDKSVAALASPMGGRTLQEFGLSDKIENNAQF